MIFPQAMSEVELVVPTSDALAVTRVLGGLGSFHQVDASWLTSNAVSGANPWQDKASALTALERRVQALFQVYNLKDNGSGPSKFDDEINLEKTSAEVERLERMSQAASQRLNEANHQLDQLQAARRDVEPLLGVDVDISHLREGRAIHTILGTLPSSNVDRLSASLGRIPHVLVPLRRDNKNALIWLAGQKSNAEVLDRAARSAYLTETHLPEGYSGKPTELQSSLEADEKKLQEQIAGMRQDLEKQGRENEKELRNLAWETRSSRMLADAIVRYGKLKFTYVIIGWVPTRNLEKLKERVRKASPEAIIDVHPASRLDGGEVPTELSANPVLKPFQFLVNTYARPNYGEIDPTFLIAITFPLLYGTMFGDVGQGLVIMLVGLLLASRRVKALRGFSALGGLLAACGFMATVFGFLYGSFFGFEGNPIHALWLEPMHNIMDILMVTIVAGIILLNLGFLINIYNNIRQRNWPHVFFFQTGLSGLLLYWGMLSLAGGAFLGRPLLPNPLPLVMLVLGVLGVMFSEFFERVMEKHTPLFPDGPVTFLIQSVFELFETLISFLGNTLSYVRVGAFAVAHGGLSAVILILAEMASPGKGIGYWIVVVLGNLFIIGFEGLIVGIQTMRLEYYEFFSKFFKGGGTRFEPLNLEPAAADH